MRDKTPLVVKPGRNLDYQILICGLMLVLQLVAGEAGRRHQDQEPSKSAAKGKPPIQFALGTKANRRGAMTGTKTQQRC